MTHSAKNMDNKKRDTKRVFDFFAKSFVASTRSMELKLGGRVLRHLECAHTSVDFIKKYASYAPLRFSTEQLNLFCREVEE